MKSTLLFSSTLALAICTAAAQEPAPAKPQLRSTPPSPLAPPPPSQDEPLPLIPDAPENTARPRGRALSEPGQDKTSAAEDELAARVRMREVKTLALKDAKVQAELDRARAAQTDLDKREAMKSYYTLLYAKMVKLDGSLQKRVALLRNTSIKRLTQHNIDPTDPSDAVDHDRRNRE